MITTEEFVDLYFNEQLDFIEVYSEQRFALYKQMKEIYKHKEYFYMLDYVSYPGESLDSIVADMDFTIMRCVPKQIEMIRTDWEVIE